jgi:hypothetical protein
VKLLIAGQLLLAAKSDRVPKERRVLGSVQEPGVAVNGSCSHQSLAITLRLLCILPHICAVMDNRNTNAATLQPISPGQTDQERQEDMQAVNALMRLSEVDHQMAQERAT